MAQTAHRYRGRTSLMVGGFTQNRRFYSPKVKFPVWFVHKISLDGFCGSSRFWAYTSSSNIRTDNDPWQDFEHLPIRKTGVSWFSHAKSRMSKPKPIASIRFSLNANKPYPYSWGVSILLRLHSNQVVQQKQKKRKTFIRALSIPNSSS